MIQNILDIVKKLRFVLFLFILSACSDSIHAGDVLLEKVRVQTSNNEQISFNVEMAVRPHEQEKGLMNRTELAENSGMLFLFGDEKPRSFWMRNTLIPLDILFLRKDGTIHHIHHMAKPQDEAHITAIHPSSAVLELNGGASDRQGVKEGDVVIHTFFNNTHL